jgi:hypothetical protein
MKNALSKRSKATPLLLFLTVCLLFPLHGASAAQTVTFAKAKSYTVGNTPASVAVGDFNGDTIPDLVVVNEFNNGKKNKTNNGQISILLGNGDGTFSPPLAPNPAIFDAGSHPIAVAVADFNEDNKLDLAVVNYGDPRNKKTPLSGSISIFLGNGDGTFGSATDFPAGVDPIVGPAYVAVKDFDGDLHQDLAVAIHDVANLDGQKVAILLGNGDGTFAAPVEFDVGRDPTSIVVGDFNGDTQPDLAVVNFLDKNVSVLLNTTTPPGPLTFATQAVYSVGNQPISAVAGKFDADGVLDLMVANAHDQTISFLSGNADGTFNKAVNFSVGKFPIGLVAADFDGDGNLDLAVAEASGKTVSVALGNGAGAFAKAKNFSANSQQFSIASGDFNGGKPDLVLAAKKLTVLLNTTP